MKVLAKALAFVRRDLLNAASYKLAFSFQVFGILLAAAPFFFLSRLFGGNLNPLLAPYGGDYFAFVLLGIAFSGYLNFALGSLGSSIREAQVTGTLEALLVTQTGIPTLVLSSSLYSFVVTSVQVVLYLVVGVLVFGLRLGAANYGTAFLVLVLTITAFGSIGIISASFILVFKKGDPVSWVFTSLSWLLAGVFYPVAVLPSWLKPVSYCLPLTYALDGVRLALLTGAGVRGVLTDLLFLAGFSVVFLPLAVLAFRGAVIQARRRGSLTQY